jgi:hypothetical protein
MDGIKPGYRSKDPSEVFNSRPQPGPGLSAGAMGPKKETPVIGMDGMMEPEEKSLTALTKDDLILTVRKLRQYIDEKVNGLMNEVQSLQQKLESFSPIINIQVPESLPPDVNINMPRRKVIKTIEYDESFRPVRTIEEEMKIEAE